MVVDLNVVDGLLQERGVLKEKAVRRSTKKANGRKLFRSSSKQPFSSVHRVKSHQRSTSDIESYSRADRRYSLSVPVSVVMQDSTMLLAPVEFLYTSGKY